jgi:glycine/D-amino acid oxidase-like deaminating enzyme
MCTGGRLDVPGYLEATRSWFASRDSCHTGILETDSLVLKPDGVWVPQLGETFARVIFCQGYGPANPWFPDLPFNPAKGEILTLKIHGLAESRTVHGGVWLARAGDVFLCGATYDWAQLDTTPTSAGRAHILSGLARLLIDPQAAIEVVEHRAAVRPTMQHFQPIAQVYPEHRQLALLNGLGSKGSLLAPCLADALVEELVTRA